MPSVPAERREVHRRSDRAKRAFDILLASVALIVISPLLVILSIAVRIALGKPILFRQERPGLHGRIFTIWKFRTMRRSTSAPRSSDAARLTRFGRFLRATSLDELPELFNVLRGDMSMVGPRPLLVDYLPLYSPEQARRHEVRPGITGLAQVRGRNALDWPERLRLDVWYVDHRSLLLDLRILARTVWAVLTRRGISAEGEATARRFSGQR